MADQQYRTVIGVVQFEPKEGTAGGKPVRNIVVRQAGFRDQAVRVNATLWPSHAHVAVEENDAVLLEGAYTKNDTVSDDGTKRTYHNLSVTRIAVLGKADTGKRIEVENEEGDFSGSDNDDDDIPF